jgi:hypothetical protein
VRNRLTIDLCRSVCVGGTILLLSFAPVARADTGKSPADREGNADVHPGGLVYVGLGASAIGALSPGAALSLELSVEVRRFLFNAEALAGNGVNAYGTLFLGGSIGTTLSGANDAPYLLAGAGYLARGKIGLPDNPQTGPEREYAVLTFEGGYAIGRSRRFGQVWLGLRALLPIATTHTSRNGSTPDFPFALFTARFLL